MDTFYTLKKQYDEIRKLGFVKSVNNNKNSVGYTIEKLLGTTGGDFNIPDYYDIEIKALRKYSGAEFDLFNSAPDGIYVCASQWLSHNYGYPDKDYRDINVFKGNVFGNCKSKIGLKYKYKLNVDKSKQKIVLEIYNIYNNKLVNNDIYWDFASLREKLERKVEKLAVFGFEKKEINGDLYVHYNSLNMYKLKSFETFINCIEEGTVFVTFKTGVYKKGPYTGKFTDHGTSFKISKNNLLKLFDKVK